MIAIRAAWRRSSLEARLGLIAGIVAIVWAILLLDPLGPATVDPDAASSVLYFQRITSGQRLEAFVPTTPKPLLTLVDGVAWALLHDWRALVWLTIGAFGVGVGSVATVVGRLARRTIGVQAPGCAIAVVAAASFSTAALLGSSDVLLEVSRANSLIWALAFWGIAGLAITQDPPRPGLAGVALLLAGLCRFETLALAAVAVAAVVIARWSAGERNRAGPASGVGGRAAVIGAIVGLLAVPIAMVHDGLLTGNTLYWFSVPEGYTAVYNAGLASIGPVSYAGTFIGRIAPEWPLVLVAVVGLVALARSRQRLVLAGIGAFGLGVAALLFWLAWRAIYISNRYYEPIDLALSVAGAVGVGWLIGRLVARTGRVGSPTLAWGAAAVGLAAGAVLVWPALPWDRRATTELTTVRQASANASALVNPIGSIRANLEPEPRAGPIQAVQRPTRSFGLFVPSRDVSRLAVETGLGLDVIGDLYAAMLAGGVDGLRAGQWVIHDGAADRPVALFKVFEVSAPTGRIEPAFATDINGIWIDRILP